MSNKQVICEKCSEEITSRDDLVTTLHLLDVVAYHENCFVREIKGPSTKMVSAEPINRWFGNFLFLFAIIFATLFILIADHKWYTFFLTLPIVYRLYSYFVYEIRTKE